MKRILIILLFLPIIVFGQKPLFTVDLANSVVATENPNKTIGLLVNSIIYEKILSDSPDSLILDLPFFGSNIILNLQKYRPYSDNLLTRVKTDNGDKDIVMRPQLLSYKLIYKRESIGILNFVNNKINSTFLLDNKQFEIIEYKGKYVLFDINNSINQSNFSCNVNQQINSIPNTGVDMQVISPVCIELAIDIDNYTRNTFSSDQETLDWALAIISGVSQLYQAQTNAEIRVVHNTIWNVTDPYNTFSSTSDVLDELRDYWVNNNSSINRDLVHFLSKRSLGGGIAYVDVLCSTNLGYAVSASLNSDTNFVFPNPTYTWNLGVVTHELGHNIGSNHTHWCGWAPDVTANPPFAGGPIDNCVDV
ncbi:MAG: M12 family metallo-peptidase, partial [Flavobacteriales bacterium]|nr:M12 family metallo-peptidase [Flavobacteriales bacterium]